MEAAAGAGLFRVACAGSSLVRSCPTSTNSLAEQSDPLSRHFKNAGPFQFLKSSSPPAKRASPLFRISASVQGISKVNGSKVEASTVAGNAVEETSEALSAIVKQTTPEAFAKNPAFGAVLAAIASIALAAEKQRQIEQVAQKTQVPVDALRQGRLVEGRLVYRQTFVIRSYEVGADKTASIETLMNHFQETALNHVWMSGLAGDGFGATHAMIRHNLIWVVTRMHVEVERYPAWGEVVEMDTWVSASGKNGMRRDWLVRDYTTGQILARATSTWVMMNQKTRRLSKMPDDVKAEISAFYLERSSIKDESSVTNKINKLDDSAQIVCSGLTPRRSDLDMNQHVNNVKYIGWMMESLPNGIQEGHELATMTLEYRRECSQSDVVQSMTNPEASTSEVKTEGSVEVSAASVNGVSSAPFSYLSGSSTSLPQNTNLNASVGPLKYTHLLRLQVDGAEIVRGRTQWRLKKVNHSH